MGRAAAAAMVCEMLVGGGAGGGAGGGDGDGAGGGVDRLMVRAIVWGAMAVVDGCVWRWRWWRCGWRVAVRWCGCR